MALTTEEINNMSDDEFKKLSFEDIDGATSETAHEEEETDNAEGKGAEDASNTDAEGDDQGKEVNEEEESANNAQGDNGEADADAKSNEEDNPDGEPSEEELENARKIALEFHKEVTQELKAVGKKFKITDAKEVRQLMQKGMDYQRKTEELASMRRVQNTLKKHGLLDPQQIAYAAELLQGNPLAIARLIKDKEVDLYEVDDDATDNFKVTPVQFTEDPTENLVNYLSDNREDSSIAEMFEVAKTFDEQSADAIIKDPTLLRVLADHKEQGIYDNLMQKVEHSRAVNGSTKPILAEYYEHFQSEYGNQNGNGTAQADKKQTNANSDSKKQINQKAKQDRKAKVKGGVNTSSTAKGTSNLTSEDIFKMSPEEFAKLSFDDIK